MLHNSIDMRKCCRNRSEIFMLNLFIINKQRLHAKLTNIFIRYTVNNIEHNNKQFWRMNNEAFFESVKNLYNGE